MSKQGMIIILLLAAAITVVYFTGPKKPKATVTAPDTISQRSEGRGLEQNPDDFTGSTEQPAESPAANQIKAIPAALPEASISASTLSVGNDLELLKERYGRENPFAPLYEMPAKPVAAETLPTLPMMQPVFTPISQPPSFKLTAISIQNGSGIAIIDGELVRTGDTIKEYDVIGIKPDQVVLRGSFGEKIALKLRQEFHGRFDTSKNEISNINLKKSEPSRTFNTGFGSNNSYAPGPLPPLPEYDIPGPDDFKSEPLPSTGYHQ
jgi:hypothetical protein